VQNMYSVCGFVCSAYDILSWLAARLGGEDDVKISVRLDNIQCCVAPP
jgi:hypothetical protein